MKEVLFIFFLLWTCSVFGQASRSELANSKIYVKATYLDKKNAFIGLQTRTDLTDTIINNTKYKKFQAEDFTDYSDKRNPNIYYEAFTDGLFMLLDKNLTVVHRINY